MTKCTYCLLQNRACQASQGHTEILWRERDCEKNTDKHFQNDLSVTSPHLTADKDFGVKKQNLSRPARSAGVESGY